MQHDISVQWVQPTTQRIFPIAHPAFQRANLAKVVVTCKNTEREKNLLRMTPTNSNSSKKKKHHLFVLENLCLGIGYTRVHPLSSVQVVTFVSCSIFLAVYPVGSFATRHAWKMHQLQKRLWWQVQGLKCKQRGQRKVLQVRLCGPICCRKQLEAKQKQKQKSEEIDIYLSNCYRWCCKNCAGRWSTLFAGFVKGILAWIHGMLQSIKALKSPIVETSVWKVVE